MHFFYLDESGDTGDNLKDKNQPIFVLGGISVRDEGWNATQEALHSIFHEYFEGRVPDGFELHSHELLCRGGGNSDMIYKAANNHMHSDTKSAAHSSLCFLPPVMLSVIRSLRDRITGRGFSTR